MIWSTLMWVTTCSDMFVFYIVPITRSCQRFEKVYVTILPIAIIKCPGTFKINIVFKASQSRQEHFHKKFIGNQAHTASLNIALWFCWQSFDAINKVILKWASQVLLILTGYGWCSFMFSTGLKNFNVELVTIQTWSVLTLNPCLLTFSFEWPTLSHL